MDNARGGEERGGSRRRRSEAQSEGRLEPERRRSTDGDSRIPVRSPATTPTLPRRLTGFTIAKYNKQSQSLRSLDRDETESVRSSCDCDHAHFPGNGTTYSGRTKRYVIHCSPTHSSSAPEDYLTPTQRANATIRKLRAELQASQAELAEREREITRLTKEIVQLRLRKLDDTDTEYTDEDQGIRPSGFRPIRLCNEVTTLCDGAPFVIATIPPPQCSSAGSEVPPSLVDSGHFEELSPYNSPRTSALEKEIDRLKTEHETEVKQIKDSTESKISELLKKLNEANQRCEELKPQLEEARARLAEMEKEKEDLQVRFAQSEEKFKDDYLQMFKKGQQAAVVMNGDPSQMDGPPSDIPALLKQLEVTREELNKVKTMYKKMLESNQKKQDQDAEVTLKFLKSAIFYFLTDRENSAGHLAAIQSILGFNEEERAAIDKMSYVWKY